MSDFITSSLDNRVIRVEVASPSTALVERLEKIPGVLAVTVDGGKMNIKVEKGADPRTEISSAVVEMQAGLLAMGYSRSEIDEAYLAAIRGSGA
jgi:Holliday junction resolvasome RuvABC DNA-binding subunit